MDFPPFSFLLKENSLFLFWLPFFRPFTHFRVGFYQCVLCILAFAVEGEQKRGSGANLSILLIGETWITDTQCVYDCILSTKQVSLTPISLSEIFNDVFFFFKKAFMKYFLFVEKDEWDGYVVRKALNLSATPINSECLNFDLYCHYSKEVPLSWEFLLAIAVAREKTEMKFFRNSRHLVDLASRICFSWRLSHACVRKSTSPDFIWRKREYLWKAH